MKPLEWIDGKVRFLDQTKLPLEEVFISTDDAAVIADAIRRLAIRGAPLIGIAAAYGIALASLQIKSTGSTGAKTLLQPAVDFLTATRPTAVNLFWALKRQCRIIELWEAAPVNELQRRLIDEALLIHREDSDMCEAIASYGIDLLPRSCSILTHCNSGVLATGGRGTAIGIITKAWETGRLRHVFIDETRPLLQGARLTAWEMKQANVPATLIVDNTAAVLMNQGKIDAVIVGADRIAMNGDVANKVGTYNTAILAKHHGIPMYVAAPVSTMDFTMNTGRDIPIEERDGKEVSEMYGTRITPQGMAVYSPAFDVTPSELLTAIITDRGVLRPPFSDSIQVLLSQISNR